MKIERNDEKMSQSDFSDQFERVKSRIAELKESNDPHLPFVNRAISDIKLYMDTLTGARKLKPKDRRDIPVTVVRSRLTTVEGIIDAIEAAQRRKNESGLIEEYKNTRETIDHPFFVGSNLKNLLEISGTVDRTTVAMQEGIISAEFSRIQIKVSRLNGEGKSRAVRQGIDDIKYYIKTLEGTLTNDLGESVRKSFKDILSIRIKILIERLKTIEMLVDLINSTGTHQSEIKFIEEYKKIEQKIETGYVPISNLKNIMRSSIGSSIFRPTPTPQIETPPRFRCSLTNQIMNDPVMATDGRRYERAAIKQWVEKNGGFGTAHSPIKKDQVISHLISDDDLKEEIEIFCRQSNIAQNQI